MRMPVLKTVSSRSTGGTLLFFLFVLIVPLYGCRGNNKNGEIIDIDTKTQTKLSEFFESFSYTVLEENDDYFMVGIDKLILDNNYIYILDRKTNSIAIFNKNGKFINAIKKQGRGPQEYLGARDFDVSDTSIYLLDRSNKRILEYTLSGKWLDEIELDDYYDYFRIIGGKYLFLSSGHSNSTGYNFIIYDIRNKKNIAEYDPFDVNNNYSRISPSSPFMDGNHVAKEFDYTVYSLTLKGMEPKYKFRFNTDVALPNNIEDISYPELHEQLLYKNVVQHFEHFYETDNFILLSYPLFSSTHALQRNLALIDKKMKTAINHRIGETLDSSYPFAITKPLLIANGVIISAMESVSITTLKENFPDVKNIQEIDIAENSGFVLFFHKIKTNN